MSPQKNEAEDTRRGDGYGVVIWEHVGKGRDSLVVEGRRGLE